MALTGPYSLPQEHTKSSLRSMGVRHQKEGKTERTKEVRQEGRGAGKEGPCTLAPQACLKELEKGRMNSKATSCSQTEAPLPVHPDTAGSSVRHPCSPLSTEPQLSLTVVLYARYQSLLSEQEGMRERRSSTAHRPTIQGASPARTDLLGDWELARLPWKAKPDSS